MTTHISRTSEAASSGASGRAMGESTNPAMPHMEFSLSALLSRPHPGQCAPFERDLEVASAKLHVCPGRLSSGPGCAGALTAVARSRQVEMKAGRFVRQLHVERAAFNRTNQRSVNKREPLD